MGLLPELKRRPRLPSGTPRDTGKWGWYSMVVIVVLWLIYSIWLK